MARLFKREINFMGNFKIFFAISAALIAFSIGAIAIRGLQMGIEFVGGTSIDFANTGNISIEQMRDAFEEAGATDAVIRPPAPAAPGASWCACPPTTRMRRPASPQPLRAAWGFPLIPSR